MSLASSPDKMFVPHVPYLLYLNGDIDHEKLQSVLEAVPHYPLGSGYCWIVLLTTQGHLSFSEDISWVFRTQQGDKAERWLCRLTLPAMFQSSGGGLGLDAWLKEHECFVQ